MPEHADTVVGAQLRIDALTALVGVDDADFSWLRARTGIPAERLAARLDALIARGQVEEVGRRMDGTGARRFRITASGRAAYMHYLVSLRILLGDRDAS